MPIPTDFVQTSEGDLDFSRGLRKTSNLVEFTVQKLSQTMNFWQGEWYLDTRKGVPYRRVLGETPDLPLLKDLMRAAALKTTGVGAVSRIDARYDGLTRTATVSPLGVRTVDGDVVPARVLILEGF